MESEQPSQAPQWGAAQRGHSALVVAMSVGFVVAGLALGALPGGDLGVALCPFRALTGYSCPGCGMTRACVATLRGDLRGSLSYHPLGWLVTAGLLGAGLRAGAQLLLDRPLMWARGQRAQRVVTAALVVFVLVFGGLRLGFELAGILTPV